MGWVNITKPTVLGVFLNKSLITITSRWAGLVMAIKFIKTLMNIPHENKKNTNILLKISW